VTAGERTPDAAAVARSMLELRGLHGDDHHPARDDGDPERWSKAPDFAADPERAAALHAATQRDRERYLSAGLTDIDCRYCHASVRVRKLGPAYTAVQWSTEAQQQCAVFAEVRSSGGNSARVQSCPRLSDSIGHAVSEGCLEEYSSAPAPGDG
jgi:hypothetical protein